MIVSTLGLGEKWRAMLPGDVRHAKLEQLTRGELAAVEVLFTYGYDLPDYIDGLTGLRWVHVGQSGMDPIPFEKLHRRGVLLTNSRGINAITIAEYAMGMMLNVVRNNYRFLEAQQAARWDTDTHLDELYGKTLGIFGLGMVGRELAKRANAFGMRVLGVDIIQGEGAAGLEKLYTPDQKGEVLPQCNYVVLCMPLTPETHHMMAATEFAKLPQGACFVNVGRGALADETAVLAWLEQDPKAHAVLDVFATEPLPPESPFWHHPRVVVTPHIAGDRQASYMPRMMEILCKNLAAYPDAGRMQNKVDTGRGF